VAVVAGGLLQDLEERMRRDLAPIEERVRPGEETRGLAGDAPGTAGAATAITIVIPGPVGAPGDGGPVDRAEDPDRAARP
jgi:diadenosine tetraphosphatase ApaH/serine/threonine PP2A family protein phosphatase